MTFQTIYRASFYTMLVFATLVLSIDATDDNKFAMLYPPAVALAGAVAFLTVDRNPRLALSRSFASVLALASAGLSIAEFEYDRNLLLLAAAHWLVYLQLIKMFLPKTVEDDWFLFLLGLVQVLVGGVISQSDKVGFALFCWALMSLWVLSLFALHRESIRLEQVARPVDEGVPASAARREIYRGLIDGPFLLASARLAGTTLALAGLIFLAMPRYTSMNLSRGGASLGQHLSGFDEEVQLGRMGEILENDNVVMSVEMFDQDDRKIAPTPDSDHLWRGATMSHYESGRWRRQVNKLGVDFGPPDRETAAPTIRQQIKLEPTDSAILFGLRPVVRIVSTSNRRSLPSINMRDGSLLRGDQQTVAYDYEVVSLVDQKQPQEGEGLPDFSYLSELQSIAEPMASRLRAIALEQVGAIPPEDIQGRARALESYLRDSGKFLYTLHMSKEDRSLDPVEDFLVNRKAGHCEYFASALTLLLRSIGIHARMVNGFKGGDYNTIAGVYTVRQKHAHSWVEAYLDRDQDRTYLPAWLTLDPTPADQRNATVARVGGVAGRFRQLTDLIRYLWIFYVVGFNMDRQNKLLYGPIGRLVEDAQRGFAIMGETIRSWLSFPDLGSFFSLRGFLVSFVLLLMLVGAFKLVAWAGRKLLRWITGRREVTANTAGSIAFHARLLRLLAPLGLERPPAETPREFARRAAIFLSGHGTGAESVADVPPLVVDAFYRIRFGEHVLASADLQHLEARLDALESHLKPHRD